MFTALAGSADTMPLLDGVISYLGREDNVTVRQAGFVALAINLLMAGAAIVSIMLTIPRGKKA